MQSILIQSHLIFSEKAVDELRPLGPRYALFCDENVVSLYGNRLLQQWKLDVTLFSFPAGEQEKCRERKQKLEDALLAQNFSRDTCMIALGGGVTTDLIGFLASTYCRGAPLVLIPTTLLAMVDAAIGGKTGVNTPHGKNLIGTFYPADKILIDPSLLPSGWTSGFAEVIKYGLIASRELFFSLKKWSLETIIARCVAIKREIVMRDPEEKLGLRRMLNFGHTIAHALEKIENFRLPHGEAVAIGILIESYISMKMGFLSSEEFFAIEETVRSFPFALCVDVTAEQVRSAISFDKKGGRFVLLRKIGACEPFDGAYCSTIPNECLEEALHWFMEKQHACQA